MRADDSPIDFVAGQLVAAAMVNVVREESDRVREDIEAGRFDWGPDAALMKWEPTK